MTSKKRIVLTLLFMVLLGLMGIFAFQGLFLYRMNLSAKRFFLTQTAQPTPIDHTEFVTPNKIINHARPDLTIDDKILIALDCPLLEGDDGDIRYCWPAPRKTPFFGCTSVMTPDSLLGGLNPSYPMAECGTTNQYVYQSGCLIPRGISYVIEYKGKYKLIDSFPEFKAIFAPIETESEALSYALATTGYTALYGMEFSREYEYYVEQLEDTHVENNGEEYIAHLYEYGLCGCGQHPTYAVDVAISRQGDVREIHREVVYREIAEKCID